MIRIAGLAALAITLALSPYGQGEGQEAAKEACIERCKESAIHALMLDPLTAAVLTPREIRAMTLEIFEAEREFLPGYK